jgi:hypothetical protein
VALELGDQFTVKDVYGYRTETQGGRLIIPVGDMAGGDRRKIVVRLASGASSSGKLVVSKLALGYSSTEQAEAARASFDGVLSAVATTDPGEIERGKRASVIEAAEAVLAAEVRQHAVDEFQNGDKVGAVRQLGLQLEKTRSQASALKSAELSQQAQEIEAALRNLVHYSADSDEGKDLVKREKHRAREIFAY